MKHRLALVWVFLLWGTVPLAAQEVAFGLEPFAHERIAVSDTAIGFTAATYAPAAGIARAAYCTVETQSIRYRVDGTDPATTPTATGHLVAVAGAIQVSGRNALRKFRAIRATGSDGVLLCTYYR